MGWTDQKLTKEHGSASRGMAAEAVAFGARSEAIGDLPTLDLNSHQTSKKKKSLAKMVSEVNNYKSLLRMQQHS